MNGSKSTVEGLDARLEALSRQVSTLREQLTDEREHGEELEHQPTAREERIPYFEEVSAQIERPLVSAAKGVTRLINKLE